jgi:hypothetical protein
MSRKKGFFKSGHIFAPTSLVKDRVPRCRAVCGVP